MTTVLWKDVHEGLSNPGEHVNLVTGGVTYYHYGCDGVDDRGWGCGYRTLQSLCSWVIHQSSVGSTGCDDAKKVPSLKEIQEALVAMGDKSPSIIGSREWIGSFEVAICMDYFLDVPCKIIHIKSGNMLKDHIQELQKHFIENGSPVMMGGDSDNASKGILGVCMQPPSLLIMDPHFHGKITSKSDLHNNSMVQWRHLDSFMSESFYNLCLPQFRKSAS